MIVAAFDDCFSFVMFLLNYSEAIFSRIVLYRLMMIMLWKQNDEISSWGKVQLPVFHNKNVHPGLRFSFWFSHIIMINISLLLA
jgi:hypothetical protein